MRELTDLVKTAQPAARRTGARLEFALVYPDKRGRNVMRQVELWIWVLKHNFVLKSFGVEYQVVWLSGILKEQVKILNTHSFVCRHRGYWDAVTLSIEQYEVVVFASLFHSPYWPVWKEGFQWETRGLWKSTRSKVVGMQVAVTNSTRPGPDDTRTLEQLQFQVGPIINCFLSCEIPL